jgi:hypothetical protein
VRGSGAAARKTDLGAGKTLVAVPSNVGPRTMPNYNALAAQGVYALGHGVRVFAGTVDDPFYIDLGSTFDSINYRPSAFASGIPAVYTAAQDAEQARNFAADDVSGFNVNAIAVELPISLLTSDGKIHPAAEAKAVIGTYASTSRPRGKTFALLPGGKPALSAALTQIQRMGNPLINELLIGTADKDKFSMSEPKDDAQFAGYLLDPLLPRVINAVYAGAVAVPAAPRNDLLLLVTYAAPICPGCAANQAGPVADLLRLNTGIPPTPQAQRNRLAFLAGDTAGYPNGRRVSDDVTDISLRVVAGVLKAGFNIAPNNLIADGVNANDRTYREVFPYVAFANSGRASRHADPLENGCIGALSFANAACPLN